MSVLVTLSFFALDWGHSWVRTDRVRNKKSAIEPWNEEYMVTLGVLVCSDPDLPHWQEDGGEDSSATTLHQAGPGGRGQVGGQRRNDLLGDLQGLPSDGQVHAQRWRSVCTLVAWQRGFWSDVLAGTFLFSSSLKLCGVGKNRTKFLSAKHDMVVFNRFSFAEAYLEFRTFSAAWNCLRLLVRAVQGKGCPGSGVRGDGSIEKLDDGSTDSAAYCRI